jgi:TRAP-type C4-dicarboxylate transport system substrate-binding protein
MRLKLTTIAALSALAAPAGAADLVYGNWTPAREYQNVNVMPEAFRMIEKETGGAIKWKLVPGGQLADAKATFAAVKDGLMQGGLAIVTYSPSVLPSVYAIYSTLIFGADDPVAASGAAMETMYLHCPACLEEIRKLNAVALGGWVSSSYILACREPVKSLADLKGKRIRATGGGAEMFKLAGAVPIGATLTEAVSLLQRGGMDCQYGITDWLRTFGYGDFTKYVMDYPLGMSGPALGLYLNRDSWKSFTPEQKKVHVKAGAWMMAKMAIGNFIIANEEGLKTLIKDKGVSVVKVASDFDAIPAEYKKIERERNIAAARDFGVTDAGAIIDAYEKAVERWRPLSRDIGRDVDKFTDVLMREVFSKVDLEKL